MRDRDIRSALHKRLRELHPEQSDTLIIDELGLCRGTARVDVAVVNGKINGFEIKSERDTLDRLPGQQEVYSQTLDQVTIVASGHHIDKIFNAVPEWWGVEEVSLKDQQVVFKTLREPASNPDINPLALAQLLWREEALAALKQLSLDKGMLSKPRRALWTKLSDCLTLAELSSIVRRQLKARENWRSVVLPASGDD
jgi:hypothetical protein